MAPMMMGQDMLKFNEQQMLLISFFVLLVQFGSPGNGMGTGRSFHLKRRRVNPPAVDEATSLWYEIVIPAHSSSRLTLLQPIFFGHDPSSFYRCQPLPLTGQLQTGLRQDSALRALLLLLRAAARLSAADQRATSNCHPLYVHHAHPLLSSNYTHHANPTQ